MQHHSNENTENDDYDLDGWGNKSLSFGDLQTDNTSNLSEKPSHFTEEKSPTRMRLGEHPKSHITKGAPASLARKIFSPVNLGLLNILRSAPPHQAQRSKEISNRVRLNMASIYCKFVIQALLYLLATYLSWMLLTLCFKLSWTVLIPLTIICAIHLAARTMHITRNKLHVISAHQNESLTSNMKWVAKRFHNLIEHSSNFALGLFSALPQKIADSHLLDRQMAHIPDNSPRQRIKNSV